VFLCGPFQISPLTATVIGKTIGSVQIDIDFATLVDNYLKENASKYYSSADPPRDYPGQFIANRDFLSNKRQFEKTGGPFYTYKLPNIPEDFNKLEPDQNGIKIERGIMFVPRYVQLRSSLKATVDNCKVR
jgi:hypothetical protein